MNDADKKLIEDLAVEVFKLKQPFDELGKKQLPDDPVAAAGQCVEHTLLGAQVAEAQKRLSVAVQIITDKAGQEQAKEMAAAG